MDSLLCMISQVIYMYVIVIAIIYTTYTGAAFTYSSVCVTLLRILKQPCMLTIRSSPIQDHELFNRWVYNRTIDRTHLDDVDVKFLLACITDQPEPMYITLQLEKIQSVCIWVIAGDNSNGISETNKNVCKGLQKRCTSTCSALNY